ncbi:unnamed protein product [Didymodactylos carnosus]|uniref:RING-type domain-containing protein n=1 Tax=Didymodactylos carnosus TaxID=1234261 RepID=A0A815SLQ9_9BILA|nr:unnamed protein product [Didymodactylos carnosus]CAF1491467.1 unnamed protein product [Didymodactylos carnosus]CAF4193987.1 unnamed protein product [Didymodactylos carnosus]CAF4354474.1 unnamed protein product [Didymodactylos carnosus]
MTVKLDYDYIEENLILQDLTCALCTDPLLEPVCAQQCGHTYCRACITASFRRKSECPTCRLVLTLDDFHPVYTRSFLNQLNQLLVKCKFCSEENIQRGNYEDHAKMCSKKPVSCAAADLNCPWTGRHNKLEEHMKTCPLMQVRPMIVELKEKMKRQTEQIQFLYTMLEKISANHQETCKEDYSGEAICDVCDESCSHNGSNNGLHYCPQTDICQKCLNKYRP